jgi:hypothetical protein
MLSKPSKPSSDAGLQGVRAPCQACSLRTRAPNRSPDDKTVVLIEIPDGYRLPMYVKKMHEDNTFTVTFDRSLAAFFTAANEQALANVKAEVSNWPGAAGPVSFVAGGV